MTVGKKIAIGFGLTLGVLALSGALSFWNTSRLIDNNEWVEHTHQVLIRLESLFSLLKNAESNQRGFILTGREPYLEPYNSSLAQIDEQLTELRTLTHDNPEQQRALDELKPLVVKRLDLMERVVQLRKKDEDGKQGAGFREAVKLIAEGEGKSLMDRIAKIIDRMQAEERRLLVERSARALSSARATLYTIGVGTPLTLLVVFVGGFFIARSNLIQRKEMEAERAKYLDSVRQTVARLSSVSTELLAGTSQQAAGAQEQAAAVTQTVATVDEVTQTSEQAVQRAKGVGEAAQRTLNTGLAGRQAVEESSAALGRLQAQVESTAESILALAEQAQAIGEIITTVNDIAEQTNLLALNAAIEASRAGEYGRGFAVVAGEVKALADQSKKATVQVRQILGEIQKATNKTVLSTEEVTRGVSSAIKLGAQAGETISALADTLAETARSAAQIVASAGQQATGMIQIHQAMKNIDQVAKQNLAATRQAEQATQNLNELGTRLAALFTKSEVEKRWTESNSSNA